MVPAARELLAGDAVDVAPRLLGAVLSHATPDGRVALRLSEVEAYGGVGEDPGSHAFRGKTARNAVMFGEAGHLYAYFTYGMHVCLNVVTGHPGAASAVLLRGATVVEGLELARARRPGAPDRDLARGPARLGLALGVPLSADGDDLLRHPYALHLPAAPLRHATGPRTGVSGEGGGVAFARRFWLPDDPGVSPYRRHRRAAG
ncbi:DNA-3-methyladenine glycosylase [Agromyces aerolatus]|uniref:DNA-3-methyladenine glycosylase n=1 Tax=Agromyces sp. LY-1074 TaxID=3074080 RepID=UPI002864A328|nr:MULTISPECIES: DNA-3-methyladenine glycosylase [unclassified Agromyces]MDR5700981.1 DNA-3-methyladenine glycosylase [Agromyces sp. LY-1074]MDR5707621.1 DNA-3-methyladenine glycosylase [Agromyces sp. LY-1358]